MPKGRHKAFIGPLVLMLMFQAVMLAGSARAALSDLPDQFAGFLGTSVSTAELILAVMTCMSVGLLLAFARAPVVAYLFIILLVLVVLTAIGWVPAWLLMIAVVLIAGIFALRMRDILAGGVGG